MKAGLNLSPHRLLVDKLGKECGKQKQGQKGGNEKCKRI